MTDIRTAPRFSAEMWAAFWAAPEMSSGADILADDIVGYWPGETEPVRGLAAYQTKIAELLAAYPDLRLELIDSATVPGMRPVLSCRRTTPGAGAPRRHRPPQGLAVKLGAARRFPAGRRPPVPVPCAVTAPRRAGRAPGGA